MLISCNYSDKVGKGDQRSTKSMKTKTALFLDVGGVLLTNGWDRKSREAAAEKFHLDVQEMDERHKLTFDTYEAGYITLDEYMKRAVFYKPRSFTPDDFKKFMFAQSKPHTPMLNFIRSIKKETGVKVVVVSNEGRELSDYRIRTFKLKEFVDIFVVSSYVGKKKPDDAIYRLALDLAQVSPSEVFYVEDRLLFVEVAAALGIQGIQHISQEVTEAKVRKKLEKTRMNYER